MTTEDYIRRDTLQAPVVSVARKMTGRGSPYLDIQVKRRDDLQWADTLKCWDPAQLPGVEDAGPGKVWNFIIAAKKLKPGKTDNEEWWSYDWQIIGLAEIEDVPEDADAPSSGPQDVPASTEAPPAQEPRRAGRTDPTRRSIEKQTALKAAVDSAQFLVTNDITRVDGEVRKFTAIVGEAYRFFAKLLEEDI